MNCNTSRRADFHFWHTLELDTMIQLLLNLYTNPQSLLTNIQQTNT